MNATDGRARLPTPPSTPLASWSAAAASAASDRYRLLAGATNDILWDWDLTTGRVVRNDALSTTFGYAPDDVEHTREWWDDRMHPDDRPAVEEQITEALAQQGAFALEYRFRRADGTWATILDRAWIMRDADGRAVRAVGSCVDVSERKALEADLRRKTERLATMMEMQRELATLSSRPDDVLTRVAERAARLVRADGAAIARVRGDALVRAASHGVTLHESGESVALDSSPFADVVRAREPLVVWDTALDTRLAAMNSSSAVRALIALPLITESRVIGVISAYSTQPRVFESEEIQAMTVASGAIAVAIASADRFEENQALLAAARESEERYRTVTDGTALRIAVIDAEQRYQFANRTISEVHNKPVREILGRRMDEILSPVNFARIRPFVLGALDGQEQHFDVAWDIPGEPSRILATRYVPRRDEAGTVTGFYVISSDETEHRRLQEQMQRTERMEAVGQLAGGVAHDFNNLLTVIGGFAQGLAVDPRLADDQREELSEIVKATRRAGDLTRRLLAFGRKQTLQPEVIDLNAVVRDNERMLRRLVREDIEFVLSMADTPCRVFADPRQIEHVLVNLIVNARDAIATDSGRITIETRAGTPADGPLPTPESGDWVELRVIDTGEGMTPEVLEHIFEPFFTTKASGEGTGLGLAMAYGIVEQSGGIIRAESKRGQGAVFTILFPRAEQPLPAARISLPTPVVSAAGELVLVVEDEEPVRLLARRVLERAGYEVIQAGNGREAMELLESETRQVHLLVSDIVMPEMGGLELAERAAKSRPGLPVLFMSGYAAAEIQRRGGLPIGASFVQKPFGPAALVAAVRDAMPSPE